MSDASWGSPNGSLMTPKRSGGTLMLELQGVNYNVGGWELQLVKGCDILKIAELLLVHSIFVVVTGTELFGSCVVPCKGYSDF